MSDQKPNPSKLDRQVHGAVRQILYNELGLGPEKMRRFLSEALKSAVWRHVADAGAMYRQELRVEFNAALADLRREVAELRSAAEAARSSRAEEAERELESVRARITAISRQIPNDAELAGRLLDQMLERAAIGTGTILKPLVTQALERAAKEAVNEFVASNFRTDVTLKPGRKIFLPGP